MSIEHAPSCAGSLVRAAQLQRGKSASEHRRAFTLVELLVVITIIAVLVGLLFSQVDYYVGFQAGLKGFTAAVLGGIGSIHGAMLGGIPLGLVESLAVTFLPSAYKDVVAFVILIAVLLLRPWGLVGEKVTEKV